MALAGPHTPFFLVSGPPASRSWYTAFGGLLERHWPVPPHPFLTLPLRRPSRKPHLYARTHGNTHTGQWHLIHRGARADRLQSQTGLQTFFGDLSKRLALKVGDDEVAELRRIFGETRAKTRNYIDANQLRPARRRGLLHTFRLLLLHRVLRRI